MESENNDNEETKWNSKMDDWDKKSREYYREYRVNYGNLQMKQRFRRITKRREYIAECFDRRM